MQLWQLTEKGISYDFPLLQEHLYAEFEVNRSYQTRVMLDKPN